MPTRVPFAYQKQQLTCDGVPLRAIADAVGTPTYVYSQRGIVERVQAMQAALAKRDSLICFSVKANSSLAILKVLAGQQCGFDIVSGGELKRLEVLKTGTDKVVFSGVGKTEDEMVAALKAGILMFNIESAEELQLLNTVALKMKKRAPFSIRINPDIDAKTHKYISTGLSTSKFGVPVADAISLYREARKMKGLRAVGVDCHIGSQLLDVSPLKKAVTVVADIFRLLQSEGEALTHIDVGGGMGIAYQGEKSPGAGDYANAVLEPLRGLKATLVVELGRSLVAESGVLLTRALFQKENNNNRFLVIDAAMNDLMRPALYEAFHEILPLRESKKRSSGAVDVVGPVCESTDVLGRNRPLAHVQRGDLLALMTAGAYGMSMASRYNSRSLPAEVLVNDGAYRVVRARESLSQIFEGEIP